MNVAAIIVGIDGWQKYTLPLIKSIAEHEPLCDPITIDNASKQPYPLDMIVGGFAVPVWRTQRLCYSAAINEGHRKLEEFRQYDWYIVLSNDVLCTGPFLHLLEQQDGEAVIGPLVKQVHGFDYVEGWCVCIPRKIWDIAGGWDENYAGSDWEDVDFSTTAREKGFWLEQVPLPFVHLDQAQRYHIVEDFTGKNAHNRELFLRKHAAVTA